MPFGSLLISPFDAFGFLFDCHDKSVAGDVNIGRSHSQRPGNISGRPFLDREPIKNLKLFEAEFLFYFIERRGEEMLAVFGFEKLFKVRSGTRLIIEVRVVSSVE